MTLEKGFDLAFKYAEHLRNENVPLDANFYKNAPEWFKDQGGTVTEYTDFIDLVHVFVKNGMDLQLGDAYLNAPDFE